MLSRQDLEHLKFIVRTSENKDTCELCELHVALDRTSYNKFQQCRFYANKYRKIPYFFVTLLWKDYCLKITSTKCYIVTDNEHIEFLSPDHNYSGYELTDILQLPTELRNLYNEISKEITKCLSEIKSSELMKDEKIDFDDILKKKDVLLVHKMIQEKLDLLKSKMRPPYKPQYTNYGISSDITGMVARYNHDEVSVILSYINNIDELMRIRDAL